MKANEIPVVSKALIYAMHGMLTICLSGNGLTRESIYDNLDEIILILIGRI